MGGKSLLSVVIVDGSLQYLSFLKDQVPWDQWGCEVVGTAVSGRDGRDLIAKYLPGLIIADVNAPVLSGLDMVELTKDLNPKRKVIFLSEQRCFMDVYRAIKLGAADYLLKPLTSSDVQLSLQHVLKNNAFHVCVRKHEIHSITDKVLEYAQNHLSDRLTLPILSDVFNIRPAALNKLIENSTGMRFTEWLTNQRIHRAAELMALGEYRVTEIGSLVGYNQYITFYKSFVRIMGCPPSDYRERQTQMKSEEDRKVLFVSTS